VCDSTGKAERELRWLISFFFLSFCFLTFSQFVGSWLSDNPDYPLNVGESQGAMVNNNLLIVSGFTGSWQAVTKQVYKLDTTNPNADWVRLDDVLYTDGVNHAGVVVVGEKFYICGVFLGRKEY